MNKLIILTVIFVFALIFIIPIILTFGIKYISNAIQPSLGNTEKIYGKIMLSSEFISTKDNLTGIGVSIKNPNFANKKNTYLNVYDNDNILLRSVVINGQNIADGKFVKILFEPISNSLEKKYKWTISSPDSTFNDALEIFLTQDNPSWSLNLRVDNQLQNHTLSYITLHKVASPFELAEQIIWQWINKFFLDRVFSIFYLLTLSMLSLYFIYLNWIKIKY